MSYGADYWLNYGTPGNSYLDNPQWPIVFGNIAAKLKERFPKAWSVLDAGCATGYLVEAFRDVGVAAWGIDSSAYAIDHVRPGARGFVKQQSLLEPIEGKYDLITAIEVLEHISCKDCERAMTNLCAASDSIVFSSSPSDFTEPTHLNVQPVEFWVERFADQGFVRDEKFKGDFIVEWAMHFTRAVPSQP